VVVARKTFCKVNTLQGHPDDCSQDGAPCPRWTKSDRSPQSQKKNTNLYQARVSAAIAFLRQLPFDVKANYTRTAEEFEINTSTLQNHYLGIHGTPQAAYEKQMVLTALREEIMMEWMFHHADEGRPWSNKSIRYKVDRMTGKRPSIDWVKAFQKHHKDMLKFCSTSGLDPKQAKAFNPQCMAKQFKELGAAFERYKYKVWNIYNFDETGMQTGGGRKCTGKKWFISCHTRARYKQWDANLELVTVVECAAADGAMLDPGFIFQGNKYDIDWFLKHPGIL